MALGVPCRQSGARLPLVPLLFEKWLPDVGVWVRHLVVSTSAARESASVGWGYPAVVADVEIAVEGDVMRCAVRDDGRVALRIEMARPTAEPRPDTRPLRTYSRKGGELVVTDSFVDGRLAVDRLAARGCFTCRASPWDATLSALYKDVFLYHWREESQHAILDELEWARVNGRLSPDERDLAVNDFIALVGAVDGILQAQASADVRYFVSIAEGRFDEAELERLREATLGAYRFQYIVSGAEQPRFLELLLGMITEEQAGRITRALAAFSG